MPTTINRWKKSRRSPKAEDMGFKRAKIVACKPRPDYHVWIQFDDGLEGEVDLSHLVGKGVFKAWDSIEFFKKVEIHPRMHTIVWYNGDQEIDLDPYVLRDEVRKQH